MNVEYAENQLEMIIFFYFIAVSELRWILLLSKGDTYVLYYK